LTWGISIFSIGFCYTVKYVVSETIFYLYFESIDLVRPKNNFRLLLGSSLTQNTINFNNHYVQDDVDSN